jgi:hypothetical protein
MQYVTAPYADICVEGFFEVEGDRVKVFAFESWRGEMLVSPGECIGSTEIREGETARTAAIRVLKERDANHRPGRCSIRQALGILFNRTARLGGKALRNTRRRRMRIGSGGRRLPKSICLMLMKPTGDGSHPRLNIRSGKCGNLFICGADEEPGSQPTSFCPMTGQQILEMTS